MRGSHFVTKTRVAEANEVSEQHPRLFSAEKNLIVVGKRTLDLFDNLFTISITKDSTA